MEWSEEARTLLALDRYRYVEESPSDPPDKCWNGWGGSHSGKLLVIVMYSTFYTICEGHRNKLRGKWEDY